MSKIKILKDTPFDKKGTLLSIADFRLKYSYVCTKSTSDDDLVTYLRKERELYQLKGGLEVIGQWFSVEKETFKVGDWVWHEQNEQAYEIVEEPYSNPFSWHPHSCTINAVEDYPGIYQRLATAEEIDRFKFLMFKERKFIVSKACCYHFNYIWNTVLTEDVIVNLKNVLSSFVNKVTHIDGTNYHHTVAVNSIRIGCKVFTRDEILSIANYLNVKL